MPEVEEEVVEDLWYFSFPFVERTDEFVILDNPATMVLTLDD